MSSVEHHDSRSMRSPRVEAFPRIITVSREFGAGGSRISLRIAAELGYQLWDQELTAYLARKLDADPSSLREVDERERPLLDEVLAASAVFRSRVEGPSAAARGRVSCAKFRTLLTHTVAELAERGGAVIVGRGANFLVGAEKALRVRVVCPLKQRIERYASAARCEWGTAARFVADKDKERERFVRQLCGEHASDPTHYDLIVNTQDLSEEDATRLIVSAYRARFGARARPSARDEVVAI